MIVLDTNVVSEFMTSLPAAAVRAWLNAQDGSKIFLTTLSVAEISFGLRVMADGQRRRLLADRFEQFLVNQGIEFKIQDRGGRMAYLLYAEPADVQVRLISAENHFAQNGTRPRLSLAQLAKLSHPGE